MIRHSHLHPEQTNLIVGALVKTKPFKDVGDKAIKAATAVNKSSSKWLKVLKEIATRFYGKGKSLSICTLRTRLRLFFCSCLINVVETKQKRGGVAIRDNLFGNLTFYLALQFFALV